MANLLRGEKNFEVDGTTYRLKYDWNAAALVEELLPGVTIGDVLMQVTRNRISARQLRAIVWAGLQAYQPDVTVLDAGRIIDKLGRRPACKLMGVALRYYFPELESEDDPEDPPKPGTP